MKNMTMCHGVTIAFVFVISKSYSHGLQIQGRTHNAHDKGSQHSNWLLFGWEIVETLERAVWYRRDSAPSLSAYTVT